MVALKGDCTLQRCFGLSRVLTFDSVVAGCRLCFVAEGPHVMRCQTGLDIFMCDTSYSDMAKANHPTDPDNRGKVSETATGLALHPLMGACSCHPVTEIPLHQSL